MTHFYVVGASGTGKTKFLEYLIRQDIKNKFGFGVIDPNGDLVRHVKELLSLFVWDEKELEERVILIDPTDKEYTVSFNPLELTEGYTAARQADELVEVFRRVWRKSWGDRMADILHNTFIALIENNLTLAELQPFLTNAPLRSKLMQNVKNEECRQYFAKEYDVLVPKTRSEWITSTTSRVRRFLTTEAIRDVLRSSKSSFNFREVIDNQKILLVRLPDGLLGESGELLGSLILAKIQMAAFSRADIDEDERVPFYLYIDEFQHFAADNFGLILDAARKFKLGLILAHQNLEQVPDNLIPALLNCPLQAYFRVLRADAEILAKELFAGAFENPQPWERYFQELQTQIEWTCYFKNKNGGGLARIMVPPPISLKKELEKMGNPKALGWFRNHEKHIGKNYLRKREDITEEYEARKLALLGADEEDEDYRQG